MGILVKVKFEFPKIEKKVDKKNLMRFFKNELVNFWVLDFLDFEKIMSSKKVDKFFFVNFSIFHFCFAGGFLDLDMGLTFWGDNF